MDNHITINGTNKETENQVLKLYFEPRKWSFNQTCKNNVGSRSFMTGPDGVLAEGYMIGTWDASYWTEIVSETLLLPKNTDCSFTFWLNGGENDRYDEVCRFEVIFNNNYEQRFTYNLNRNYILPVKKLNGWELYEIPFRTEDNEYTELRFVAHRAYMTVLAAKDISAYESFADNADPFEAERPQRHNIIFSDGYPANGWYSTKALQEAHKRKNAAIPGIPQLPPVPGNQQNTAGAKIPVFLRRPESSASANDQNGSLRNTETSTADSDKDLTGASATALVKESLDAISANLDVLSSTCDMLEDFDVDSIADNIRAAQENEGEDEEDEDWEDILSDATDFMLDIADEFRDKIEEIADQLEEIRDSLSI